VAHGTQRQKLRLFIEGVELPIVSCSVQAAMSAPAVAAVKLPPVDELHDIAPRASVQIFFFDSNKHTYVEEDGSYKYKAAPANDIRRWKLLFNGILRAYDTSRSAYGDWETTLHLAASTMVYDSVQQYYAGYGGGGSSYIDQRFMGYPHKAERKGKQAKNLGNRHAPTAVYNIIKEGSDLYAESGVSEGSWIAGVRLFLKKVCFNAHPFWEVEYKRTRVGDMVVGFDADRTSEKLFPKKKFKKIIKDGLGQLGARASARQIANFILNLVNHTWWENPCPHLSLGSVSFPEDKVLVSGDDPIYTKGYPGAELTSAYIIPDLWWATPPRCNIFFPDSYSTFQTGRDYLNEPTRVQLRTEVRVYQGSKGKSFRDSHYAPNITGSSDSDGMSQFFSDAEDLSTDFNSANARVTLPWEKFTGPVPNIHQITHIPSKSRSNSALRALLGHSANFDFWSLRLNRSAALSGPFNPYVAVGLPAAVVRETMEYHPDFRPGESEYIPTGGMRRRFLMGGFRHVTMTGPSPSEGGFTHPNAGPWHYPQVVVGRVVALSHQITQNSAMTTVQMDHTRFHDEDFDLDGISGDDLEGMLLARNFSADEDSQFFGDNYRFENIGEKVYKPLFGVGTLQEVVDERVVDKDLDTGKTYTRTDGTTTKVKAGSRKTQRCLDFLTWDYAATRNSSDLSTSSYTHNITARPIADLVQIFGMDFARTHFSPGAERDYSFYRHGEEVVPEAGEEGFLGSCIAGTGDELSMKRIKKDKSQLVDKGEIDFDKTGSSAITETDPIAGKVQEINDLRKRTVEPARRALNKRVTRG